MEAVAWLVGSGYGDMPPELAQVAESIRLDRLADDAGGPQACAIVPTEGVPPGQNEWRSAEDCLVLPCPVTRTEADQVFRLNRKDKKLSPGRARGMHALIDAYPSEVPPNDLGESVARELRKLPIEDPEWAPYLLTPSGTRPHATALDQPQRVRTAQPWSRRVAFPRSPRTFPAISPAPGRIIPTSLSSLFGDT